MKKKNVLVSLVLALAMSFIWSVNPFVPTAAASDTYNNIGWESVASYNEDIKAWVDKKNLEPDPWSQTVTVHYEINCIFKDDHNYDWYIKVAPHLIKKLNSERVGNKIKGSWTIKLSDLVDPKNNKNTPNGDYEFSFFGPGGIEMTFFGIVYISDVESDQYYITPDTRFIVADVFSQLTCPSHAAPGESVTVSWDKAAPHPDAWIGFYKWGEPDKNPIRRIFLSSLSGNQWTLPSYYTGVPPGLYDFRIFRDNSGAYFMNGKADIQFMYNAPTINVTPNEAHPGEDIRVVWSGGPPHDPTGHMAVYHNDTLWGAFTSGLDPEGDVKYHLHTKIPPGLYTVRMYAQQDVLVGTSNCFAVVDGTSQSPGGGSGGGGSPSSTGGTSTTGGSGSIVLTIGQDNMLVNGTADPSFHDTPVIVENRVFVPIGAIIRAMGGSTGWSGDEQKVSISLNGRNLNLWIGQNRATINGQEASLDVPPFISSSGRTMLPLGFISQNLGSQINWDGANQRVTINYGSAGSSSTGSNTGTSSPAGSNTSIAGLVAQYKFSGDFKDTSGNGIDGTKQGEVFFADDNLLGKCAVFNGGFLNIKSTPGLNLGDKFTVAVWVMVDPAMAIPNNKSGPIISKLNDAGTYNNYIWYTKGTYGMRADLRTNKGEKLIQNKAFTDYKLNESWSHLVFSGDGQNLYLYHNGSLISTQAIGSGVSITTSSGDMRIGNGNDINNKNLFYKGKMADLRIYNRALSPDEVKSLYSAVAGK